MGKSDRKHAYHTNTNENGALLLDFAIEKSLLITNTHFQKPENKLWTHLSPKGDKCQLDYILIRKKWRNSLKNTQAYNSFASVGSDHRIVSAHVKLSLRSNTKTTSKRHIFDWKVLANDDELQSQYAVLVKNKFTGLETESGNATDTYEKFILANKEAAEELIPRKAPTRKEPFSNDKRVAKARKEIQLAYDRFAESPSESEKESYNAAKKNLEGCYKTVIEEDLETKVIRV